MIIFNSWHTAGKSNIYAADDDGSHLRCLTSHFGLQRCQRLRISPRRDRLLFYAQPPRQDTCRFFFWEFGSDRLKAYEQEPYPFDMRWLTDERLLCIKKGRHWIADIGDTELADAGFLDDYLVMDAAPDGNRVLLKKGHGIGGSTYVGYIEQQQVVEILRGDEYGKSHSILYPASWSPDGRAIACVGGYEDEIWLVNADGSNPRKVADSDYFWRDLQWSPDSSKIAFTRSLDGRGPSSERGGVFVKNLQNGGERQVLTLKRSERWRWSPEGQSIVYSKGNTESVSVWRINIQTGSAGELIGHASGLSDVDELIVT